ncbi:MAG: FAD-dependent oxidoreductase [Bacteroidetes bacterium]|nr:FAD-dependent oxidoreductase [Bacteroidota bacterium]
MKSYRYAIIGGGMAAHAAVQGIREIDSSSPIAIFGEETTAPYRRPALSKDLWKGDVFENAVLEEMGANTHLHLGERIAAIDPGAHRIRNSLGEECTYEKLLLATGGLVRRLPFDDRDVQYYRTVADYRKLRAHTGEGKRFLVIGGGFIGSEIAAALAMNGERVTMLFPERGIGGRVFPDELSTWLNDYYREKGIDVQSGVEVTGLEHQEGSVIVHTNLARTYEADHILAGIGIVPDTILAEEAKLSIDNGIVVDRFLRSSVADVYAAGDVASFPQPALGMNIRVEHEDNTVTMGKHAGRNMALQQSGNDAEAYDHLPMFYSDLFDLGYEAVGRLNARLETIVDWQDPFRAGIIYYLDDTRVHGVLLWNVWEKVDAARALIAHPGPFTRENFENWRLSMN